MAADFTTYVYESVVVAGLAEEACRSAQIVGSIWVYLCLQDSPWKSRMVGQDGGP